MEAQGIKSAALLHKNVPPDWYFTSIKENLFQRYWHKVRFEVVAEMSQKVAGRVLDIGSADGMFTQVIAAKTRGKQIIGIDVLKESVAWANKHWRKNRKMKFKVADAHKIPFKAGWFDAVYALEVLEHVQNPRTVLKEIKRVLKKDGYAIFLVPTDSLLFKTLWDYIWTKTRGKIWNDTHIQTYKDDKLVKMCKEAGFKIIENRKFLIGMLQAIKLAK